jgi:hypothetical protein
VTADWNVPGLGDVAASTDGRLWAVSGTDVVRLSADGRIEQQFASGLTKPRYLAIGPGRIAAVDRENSALAILDAGSGKVVKTLDGKSDPAAWAANGPDTLRAPRGAAFFPDGRLLLAEHLRVRCLWPDTGRVAFEAHSTFLDICTPHPLQPEYVYSKMGVMRVDPASGAWTLVSHYPVSNPLGRGYFYSSVVLGGRPLVVAGGDGGLMYLFDVTDPAAPRLAVNLRELVDAQNRPFQANAIRPDGALVAWASSGKPKPGRAWQSHLGPGRAAGSARGRRHHRPRDRTSARHLF